MAASPSRPPKLESMPSFTTLETTATTKPGTILEVCVFLGRELAAKDPNGLSDPYLKVFLLDKNGKTIKKSLQKSKIVKESLNPAFVDAHYQYSELPSGTSAVCVEVWGMFAFPVLQQTQFIVLFLVFFFCILLELTLFIPSTTTTTTTLPLAVVSTNNKIGIDGLPMTSWVN